MFPIGLVLQNKPIRRPGTTPSMCGDDDDSSSVTAAGRRSLKKSLEAKVMMGAPKQALTAIFREGLCAV